MNSRSELPEFGDWEDRKAILDERRKHLIWETEKIREVLRLKPDVNGLEAPRVALGNPQSPLLQ